MSTDEQASRPGGSVPQAFRVTLAWHWAKDMPRQLRGGFLTALYALTALADASGQVRFNRDKKPIRISDIAVAAGCDQKDVRRYLAAAEASGVVTVLGEKRRGRANLYVILVAPKPDWGAAVACLDSTRRAPRKPPPWVPETAEKKGGESPELFEPEFGGLTPELWAQSENKVRGTHPRMSSGDSPPNGSGDSPPNNPGVTQEVSHAMADVVSQPQVVAPAVHLKIIPGGGNTAAAEPEPDEPSGFVRCTACHGRMVPRTGRPNIHAHCDPDAATKSKPSRHPRIPKAGDG